MFNKYNKYVININNITNKNFKINYKNFNKIFANYLTRFTITIVLLNFSLNVQKVYFTKNLTNRLQQTCIVIQENLTLSTLIKRMRQIDQEHQRTNKNKELYQSYNM